jgi:predicted DNA-binding transcriptional regulator AlpA
MHLSVKELASRINKHPRHVRHLITNGMFPNVTKGIRRAYLIPEEDVAAYEERFEIPDTKQTVRYFTSRNVADILSCSVSHVNYLTRTGKFPNAFKQPNNKHLIPETDIRTIEEYLKSSELLSVNQALMILQVSKSTLWKWLNKGFFPNAFKLKEWRITQQDISSFLNTPRSPIEEISPMTVIAEFKNRVLELNFANFNKTLELYQEFVL